MKRSLLSASLTFAVAIGSIGIVPLAKAAAGDSTIFSMVKSPGAISCLSTTAHGRVTISDLGPVQNMHVEVFDLPANTEFTLFVINTPNAPFVPAWYQGDLTIGQGRTYPCASACLIYGFPMRSSGAPKGSVRSQVKMPPAPGNVISYAESKRHGGN